MGTRASRAIAAGIRGDLGPEDSDDFLPAGFPDAGTTIGAGFALLESEGEWEFTGTIRDEEAPLESVTTDEDLDRSPGFPSFERENLGRAGLEGDRGDWEG